MIPGLSTGPALNKPAANNAALNKASANKAALNKAAANKAAANKAALIAEINTKIENHKKEIQKLESELSNLKGSKSFFNGIFGGGIKSRGRRYKKKSLTKKRKLY
jgi:hypothetical protein